MKRKIAFLLVLGLVAGLLAPSAAIAKKKKKKAVPVDAVYHIVWNGEGCALSTTTEAASTEDSCGDPFAGETEPILGTGPWAMPALDGLPLTLDGSKPIKASISVSSYYATGIVPDVMGVGQAQIHAILTGTSGGEELALGEVTTEPYTVTPAQADYKVDFEFPAPADFQGRALDGLTLSMELVGHQMFHGVFNADGTSTLTIGAYGTK